MLKKSEALLEVERKDWICGRQLRVSVTAMTLYIHDEVFFFKIYIFMLLTGFLTLENLLNLTCLSFLACKVGMMILSPNMIVKVSERIPVKCIGQSPAFSNLLINAVVDDSDVINCLSLKNGFHFFGFICVSHSV